MQAAGHVAAVGHRREVERFRIVDDEEYLRLDAEERVLAGFGDARAEPDARSRLARGVDPVDLDRVPRVHAAVGPLGGLQLGGGEIRRLVAGVAAVLGVAHEDAESRALVLRVGVRVEVAEVQLAGRGRQWEHVRIQPRRIGDVPWCLRPHVEAQRLLRRWSAVRGGGVRAARFGRRVATAAGGEGSEQDDGEDGGSHGAYRIQMAPEPAGQAARRPRPRPGAAPGGSAASRSRTAPGSRRRRSERPASGSDLPEPTGPATQGSARRRYR